MSGNWDILISFGHRNLRTQLSNTLQEFVTFLKTTYIGDPGCRIKLEINQRQITSNNVYQEVLNSGVESFYGTLTLVEYSQGRAAFANRLNQLIDRKMDEIKQELLRKFNNKMKIIEDKIALINNHLNNQGTL